jgi:hypothetical protein
MSAQPAGAATARVDTRPGDGAGAAHAPLAPDASGRQDTPSPPLPAAAWQPLRWPRTDATLTDPWLSRALQHAPDADRPVPAAWVARVRAAADAALTPLPSTTAPPTVDGDGPARPAAAGDRTQRDAIAHRRREADGPERADTPPLGPRERARRVAAGLLAVLLVVTAAVFAAGWRPAP